MSRLNIEVREYKALPLVFFMKAGLIIANTTNSGGQSDQELYMINMREIIPIST